MTGSAHPDPYKALRAHSENAYKYFSIVDASSPLCPPLLIQTMTGELRAFKIQSTYTVTPNGPKKLFRS